jgi:hypothetical protein
MAKKERTSLKELLDDSVSLPDMIAIFLGVLELIKIRKILIYDSEGALLDMNAEFTVNQNQDDSKNEETFVSDFDEISKKGDQQ